MRGRTVNNGSPGRPCEPLFFVGTTPHFYHHNVAWIYLIVAGILEVGWAIGLKYTKGFTVLVPSILTVAAIVLSMILLSLATRTLPIGTAYAIWVGIGAVGAATLGMIFFDEPRTPARIFFLALLVAAIIGLKLTSSPVDQQDVVADRERSESISND